MAREGMTKDLGVEPLDIPALRAVAEKATPWKDAHGDVLIAGQAHVGLQLAFLNTHDEAKREAAMARAAYIATFDPPTILSLLDRLSRVEEAFSGLQEAITTACDWFGQRELGKPTTNSEAAIFQRLDYACSQLEALALGASSHG